jgi:hypothetical protein
MLPPIDPNAPRFFLDSSVILAGSASLVGASHALLVLGEIGFIRLITIPYVFEEVERNLAKKLIKGLPRYQQIREAINWEIIPNPSSSELDVWRSNLAEKDIPILVGAINAKPERLITLDTKHFLNAQAVSQKSGIVIATPRDVVNDIRAAISAKFT